MRIQSRFISLLLFVALSASGLGNMLAASSYVDTAHAANAVDRDQNYTYSPAGHTNQEKDSLETKPLPAAVMNAELKALDGSTFRLADYQGKVVVVNLWATWCGPCRSEIPSLIEVSREFKAKGVEIVGVTNEDPETDAEKVLDFVDEFKITYQIGWGDLDFVLALMQGKVRNNIPQTFVISRDGRVLKRFVGYNRAKTPSELRKALDDALNEK